MGSKGNKTNKTKSKTDTTLINKQPDTRFPYGVRPCIFFSRGMKYVSIQVILQFFLIICNV